MRFFEDSSMRANLVYTADVANRNNTSLYMVDPRGLAVYESDLSQVAVSYDTDQAMLRNLQDTLYVLAEESDGRAIVNRNDIGPGLAQIVRDSSVYYLLGYTSSERPTDGKFHEVEVKVKREDVTVRARKGYYALTESNAARVLAPPKPPVPTEIDRVLTTLAEPSRGRLGANPFNISKTQTSKAHKHPKLCSQNTNIHIHKSSKHIPKTQRAHLERHEH